MIFDESQNAILRRVQVRKGLESVTVGDGDGFTPLQAMFLRRELSEDVARCSVLLALANDDLGEIGTAVSEFKAFPKDLPRSIMDAYIGGLRPDDRADEEAYRGMVEKLTSLSWFLYRGSELACFVSTGSSILRPMDIPRCREMKAMLEGIQGLSGQPEEYRQTMVRMCSLIFRIYSGREVGSAELDSVFLGLTSADRRAMDSKLVSRLDPESKKKYRAFRKDDDYLMTVLVARMVLNSWVADSVRRPSCPGA